MDKGIYFAVGHGKLSEGDQNTASEHSKVQLPKIQSLLMHLDVIREALPDGGFKRHTADAIKLIWEVLYGAKC